MRTRNLGTRTPALEPRPTAPIRLRNLSPLGRPDRHQHTIFRLSLTDRRRLRALADRANQRQRTKVKVKVKAKVTMTDIVKELIRQAAEKEGID